MVTMNGNVTFSYIKKCYTHRWIFNNEEGNKTQFTKHDHKSAVPVGENNSEHIVSVQQLRLPKGRQSDYAPENCTVCSLCCYH